MINPRAVCYTNYIDKRIYLAIFTAAEIKYTALYKIAVQAFQGEVIGSGVFRVAVKAA